MEKKNILSTRRESIVYKTKRRDQVFVCKSYSGRYKKYSEDYYSDDSFFFSSYPPEQRKAVFNKELGILRAFNEIKPLVVPKSYSFGRKEKMRLYMELIPYPTFQEIMKESPDKAEKLTSDLVTKLAEFHIIADKNLDELVNKSKINRKYRLKSRNKSEETKRLFNYFQAVIFHLSGDLENYWLKKGLNPERLSNKEIRKRIKRFLSNEIKFDLESRVKKIVENNQFLNFKGERFVHGDFGPQNVFYTKNDRLVVIDFDKSRIGNQLVDLNSAIYNIHRYPFKVDKETLSIELAKEYFLRTEFGLNQEQIKKNMSCFIQSNLLYNVYRLANFCQMNDKKIKNYLGKSQSSNHLDNSTREDFLNSFFLNRFKEYFNYYRYREGQGWYLLLEDLDKQTSEVVRNQFSLVEEILKATGVMHGQLSHNKHNEKVKKILSYKVGGNQ